MKYLFLVILLVTACGREESDEAPATVSDSTEVKTIKGDDGEDGVTTVITKEIPVEVETDLMANEWMDPVTKKIWLIANAGQWAAASTSCGGDYRTSSSNELSTAATHGLFNVAGVTAGWTIEAFDATNGYYVSTVGGVVNILTALKGGSKAIFCVK